MLEIINGSLLLYFLFLCIISAGVPILVKPIAIFFSKPSSADRILWTELQTLKEEQSKLSMKDDFAAYSKMQRKINKLESGLKENSQNRLSRSLAIRGTVHLALQGIVAFVMIVSAIWYRREPIVKLKGNLFPFTTMLRYPSEMDNAVSAHIWVLVCNYSIRTLIKPLTS